MACRSSQWYSTTADGGSEGRDASGLPESVAKATTAFQAIIGKEIHYDKVGEAAGAHSECIEDPRELRGSIARCLDAVRSGRAAVLVARLDEL